MMCFEKKEMTWIADNLKILSVIAVLCVGMLNGCSVWDEDVEDVSRTRMIGYSGDSLLVYIEESVKETCLDKPLGADCSTKNYGTKIVVDNFYTEEQVWKSSNMDDTYMVNVYDLVNDSTVIEFNKSKSTFYKWTLGKGRENIGSFSWSGCNSSEYVKSIRNWGEGKLRLVGGGSNCAYAIADIKAKNIVGYNELDVFAEGCSDLWDYDGMKYCVGNFERDTIISRYERFQDGIYIRNEKGVVDSLWSYKIKEGANALSSIVLYKNAFIEIKVNYTESALIELDYNSSEMITFPFIWVNGFYWSENK